MKQNLLTLCCFLLFIPALKAANPAGIYGGCNCETDHKGPKLILNEDNTFLYRNDLGGIYTGTWRTQGKYVFLIDKERLFSQRWKLETSGMCIKSREALLFLRICKKEM